MSIDLEDQNPTREAHRQLIHSVPWSNGRRRLPWHKIYPMIAVALPGPNRPIVANLEDYKTTVLAQPVTGKRTLVANNEPISTTRRTPVFGSDLRPLRLRVNQQLVHYLPGAS